LFVPKNKYTKKHWEPDKLNGKMKKQSFSYLAIAIIAISVAFTSCKKEDTLDTEQGANFTVGDGLSATTAYEINTPEKLVRLAKLVNAGDTDYNNKYYKLTANIDLSAYGTNFNDGRGWIPIGNSYGFIPDILVHPFRGNFDGNGFVVSNLFINDSISRFAGLFGDIQGGTIKNLGVINVNITGKNYVGGVAGSVYMGKVTNCYSIGTVSGNDYVGGVVGAVHGGYNNSVTDCYATGTVNGNNYVGGVAGAVSGSFNFISSATNCYSTGAVNGNNYVGGVFGYVETCDITNCHAKGAVNGKNNYIGGVTGYVDNGIVTDCYATGEVKGNNYVGGITGYIFDSGIANCYATGAVNGKNNWVGGVAGSVSYSIVTNCYAKGNVSGGNNWVGGVVGEAKGSGIANCYATGAIKGNRGVGGIAGYIFDSSIF